MPMASLAPATALWQAEAESWVAEAGPAQLDFLEAALLRRRDELCEEAATRRLSGGGVRTAAETSASDDCLCEQAVRTWPHADSQPRTAMG